MNSFITLFQENSIRIIFCTPIEVCIPPSVLKYNVPLPMTKDTRVVISFTCLDINTNEMGDG